MRESYYFDNNATTRPLPDVVEAVARLMRDGYGNPSSAHQLGQAARHAVECAREQVAALIGASPKEMIFTGGGTESINLAIRGYVQANPKCRRFVTTSVEHTATLRIASQLEAEGIDVAYVGVDADGQIDEAEWASALTEETALASILHVNNETGVVWDVQRLAAIASERGIPIHVDAVQSVGKMEVDVGSWPVDLLSCSGHKFHGPKGVGALFVRRRTRIAPILLGGMQEREMRGGTENVPAIVGMGVASQRAAQDAVSVAAMRDRLEQKLLEAVPFARVIGGGRRIHNTTNLAFAGLSAEAILLLMSEAGIYASSGSACSSGSLEPSHVVRAMGVDPVVAQGAVRFSLSHFNTIEEVDKVVTILPQLLGKLKALAAR